MNELEWNSLRKFSQCALWRDTPFLILGATGECEEKWYASDPSTKPSDYDQFEFEELCAQRGMGSVRLQKIHSILSMLVGENNLDDPVEQKQAKPSIPPGVPDDWPISLIPLSGRSRKVFKDAGVLTVRELIEAFLDNELNLNLEAGGVGKKTIEQIEKLRMDLTLGDSMNLRQWFPIADGGGALSIDVALTNVTKEFSEEDIKVLKPRLIEGKTLEEAAQVEGKTRERVRQIESSFLAKINLLLEQFIDKKKELWDAWQRGNGLSEVIESDTPEITLSLAGVAACFRSSDEGKIFKEVTVEKIRFILSEAEKQTEYWLGELNLEDFTRQLETDVYFESIVAEVSKNSKYGYDKNSKNLRPTGVCLKKACIAYLGSVNNPCEAKNLLNFLKRVSPLAGPSVLSELRNTYWNRWKKEEGFEGFEDFEVIFPNLHPRGKNRVSALPKSVPCFEEENEVKSDIYEDTYSELPDAFENGHDSLVSSTFGTLDSETDFEPEIIVDDSPEKELLRKLNARILELLSQEEGQTLLGLLPIDDFEQEELISALRKEVSGDHRRLRRYLELFPGVTAYACAFIVSKWYEGGSCWPIFEREDGLAVPVGSSDQGSFTLRFKYVCRRTLYVHLAEEGESGGRVDALLAQAAIVKQWVPHLADAVKAAEREFILPDPEDEHGLRDFSLFLAGKVPQAQARLERFLRSSNGVVLARSLAVSVLRGNFENLPVHMRGQMKDALENAGGSQMKGPYLRLGWTLNSRGEETSHMFLVLPSQRGKVISDYTQWKIEQGEGHECRFSAIEEREVPANPGENHISMLNPKRGSDRKWSISGAPSNEEPFFVFDSITGRKRKKISYIQDGSIQRARLPAGNYAILALPSSCVITHDGTENTGKDPLEIGLRPGKSPAQFLHDNQKWVFEAERKPGMRLNFPVAKELHTDAGRVIRYGDLVDGELWVPQKSGEEIARVSIKSLHGQKATLERTFEVPLDFGENGFAFANLTAPFSEFIDELLAGIHEIVFDYGTDSSQGTPYRFQYWKGLIYDGDGILKCNALPDDYDPITWRGLEANGNNLLYRQDRGGPMVQIICGGEPDSVRKDGVFVRLEEKNGEGHFIRPQDPPLAIQDKDDRSLVFETSNPGKWLVSICATEIDGEREFMDFTERRINRKVRLGSILAAYGRSGKIFQKAREEHLSRRPLLSYGKRVVGRKLKLKQSEIDPSRFEASFRLPRNEFTKIRIVARDVFKEAVEQEVVFESEEVICGEYGRFWHDSNLGYVTLSMEKRSKRDEWKIVFAWQIGMPEQSIYFFDMMGKKDDSQEFEMIELDDHPNPSNARFFAGPNKLEPCREDDGPWKRLFSSVRHYDEEFNQDFFSNQISFEGFSTQDIELWFGRFRKLLLFKYHSYVWERVNWMQNAFFFFCKQAFKQDCIARTDTLARNAVLGLTERAEERESLSLISSLTFGQNQSILALPADAFVPVADELSPETAVESSYIALGKISQTERICEALDFGARMRDFSNLRPLALFRGFENFTTASSGQTEFKNFNWDWILNIQHAQTQGEGERDVRLSPFWEDMIEAESENKSFGPDTIPLSPHHCAVALKRLRRRVNRIQSAQIEGFLASQRSSLTRAYERGQIIIEPTIKRKVGIENFRDLDLPLADLLAQSDPQTRDLFKKSGQLLFLLAGWASLRAANELEEVEYADKLNKWFGINQGEADEPFLAKRICLLLSLGPEWFAFLRLFWEVILRTR